MTPPPLQNDDQATLDNLRRYGADHGHRITAPREYVLQIVAHAEKPLTAYEVLEKLAQKLEKPKPPTAYRALDFLVEHGFLHRIESLNAYIACAEDHQHRGSQFMICDSCGRVEEIHLCHIPAPLHKQAEARDFTLSHWNTELHGRCGKCV